MEIKRTRNYEMFKFRKENREINYNKVMNLKSKLLEDGRQILPIICNKDMEIIDGQHRFEAVKELNWEVMYYIDEAITSLDLVSINNTQKNWGLKDYIHYYSSLGNKTYKRIEEICKEYNEIPLKALLPAIATKYVHERDLKSGVLNFTEEEFERGEETLKFIKRIISNIRIKITSPAIFFFLIIKTYYLEGIDRDRLYDSIVSKYGTENYGNADQCAIVIEHWYNYKLRTYRYISNEILPKR